jgi:hypothetical protein
VRRSARACADTVKSSRRATSAARSEQDRNRSGVPLGSSERNGRPALPRPGSASDLDHRGLDENPADSSRILQRRILRAGSDQPVRQNPLLGCSLLVGPGAAFFPPHDRLPALDDMDALNPPRRPFIGTQAGRQAVSPCPVRAAYRSSGRRFPGIWFRQIRRATLFAATAWTRTETHAELKVKRLPAAIDGCELPGKGLISLRASAQKVRRYTPLAFAARALDARRAEMNGATWDGSYVNFRVTPAGTSTTNREVRATCIASADSRQSRPIEYHVVAIRDSVFLLHANSRCKLKETERVPLQHILNAHLSTQVRRLSIGLSHEEVYDKDMIITMTTIMKR